MHRFEVRHLVGWWELVAGTLGLLALAGVGPELVVRPYVWRVAGLTAAGCLGSIVAGAALLRGSTHARRFSVAMQMLQLPSLSVGPLAYHFLVGPFAVLSVGSAGGLALFPGVDAHFLLLLGAANHLPQGIGVNLPAALALLLLLGRRVGHPTDERALFRVRVT
jgi:hypothetical protein